jgi:hypothetical protein
VNTTLTAMSADFAGFYSRLGRPGIPPERLLRALLLQCFYSLRSERQLMERLELDLLFRWFVGLGVDDPVWDASTFSKNRDRLLAGEVAQRFLAELLARPEVKRLLSSEHSSVEDADPGLGQPEELPPQGRRRRAARTGEERRAQLQAREALERDPCQHHRSGRAALPQGKRSAGGALLYRARAYGEPQRADGGRGGDAGDRRRRALGGARTGQGRGGGSGGSPSALDKAYDTADFVMECREEKGNPHVAQNITTTRGSRIDGRTTRHPGYAVSLRIRKRIEEGFGWTKEVAGLAQVKLRGLARVGLAFVLGLATYNLVRLPKLLQEASP